jgi:prostaglandin-H2 D-isomerase / glutathione transferase
LNFQIFKRKKFEILDNLTKKQKMVKYVLHYFSFRGRGEVARLLFHAAGVEFTDHRFEFSDFPEEVQKAPLAAFPWLEVDNVKLPQSLAIGRYLAREFKLDGKTSIEKAQADVIVDTCQDLVTGIGPIIVKMPEGPEKVK